MGSKDKGNRESRKPKTTKKKEKASPSTPIPSRAKTRPAEPAGERDGAE